MKQRSDFSNNESYKEYLRFYYAGLALQGIVYSESQNKQRTQQDNARYTAQTAVTYADELIKLLETCNLFHLKTPYKWAFLLFP